MIKRDFIINQDIIIIHNFLKRLLTSSEFLKKQLRVNLLSNQLKII